MLGIYRKNPHKRQARPEIWQLARRSCQLAGAVHTVFFFLFLLLDSPFLAWTNVLSVGMYCYAYYAFNRRQNRLAVLLIRAEVLLYAGLGTILIGWQSGIHYFLLMFIPPLFISMRARSAWILVFCLWVYYVALDVLMWYFEPLQPISAHALWAVQMFNLAAVFGMFSYLSLFYVKTVTRAHERLGRMATTDPLTGLFNRGHMIVVSEKELARHQRRPSNLIFMLMDVDHFKQINDQYGHGTGDLVLIRVSQLLTESMRKQDCIGRWGGEEFLAVLPETDIEQATAIAERIRKAVKSLVVEIGSNRIGVTITIGVTQYRAAEFLSNAVARADQALYEGKSAGRNRVEVEKC